ncbi:GatB/YqeY domain-containing protein [Methylophilaceae bacterium]|nr:GatB/YqeY domain-containing protein [Methylophilaceae bacterium]
MSIRQIISDDMKTFMRAKDSARLGAIRLLQAAIKQKEVDERIELNNDQIFSVIQKMLKQRKDSIEAYQKASRQDLIDQEQLEIEVLSKYMPEPLSEEEINQYIEEAIATIGASDMKDMGKVVGILKSKVAGRADMAEVSKLVRQKLS